MKLKLANGLDRQSRVHTLEQQYSTKFLLRTSIAQKNCFKQIISKQIVMRHLRTVL